MNEIKAAIEDVLALVGLIVLGVWIMLAFVVWDPAPEDSLEPKMLPMLQELPQYPAVDVLSDPGYDLLVTPQPDDYPCSGIGDFTQRCMSWCGQRGSLASLQISGQTRTCKCMGAFDDRQATCTFRGGAQAYCIWPACPDRCLNCVRFPGRG